MRSEPRLAKRSIVLLLCLAVLGCAALARQIGGAAMVGLRHAAEHLVPAPRVEVMASDGEDLPSTNSALLAQLNHPAVDVVVAQRKNRVESFRLTAFHQVLFVALLLACYLHTRCFTVNVVCYAAIADSVIAAVVTGLLIAGSRSFNRFEKLQPVVIWPLSGHGFAISVPTVIDRSLSFYILEKRQQRGGGILHDPFADVFADVFAKEYLKEHRLVDVRLTEQQASGTIVIHNGCVKLTPKGQQLAGASRCFRQHCLPKRRLLMREYPSDLTDPFRTSAPIEDHKCQ